MKIYFCGASYEVHESWEDFFSAGKLAELSDIGEEIGSNFTPSADKVLRFCAVDLTGIKVIILGQDPYPQQGVATGRSFEVGNIGSWAELKRNASLVNILKLLHMNYLGADDIVGISEIRADIERGEFPVLPPSELFAYLEAQGVLFLNAALSCEIMKPGSHTEVWRRFSSDLLKFIAAENKQARWMLWGKDAQEFCSFVAADQKMTSYHPRLFDKKEGSFLYENHFAKVKNIRWVE